MTEFDWKRCNDPQKMLEWLRHSGNAPERKLRLFACACCRGIWHRLSDKCSRRAVEVVERFADGQATPQTFRKWHWAAYEAYEVTGEAAYAVYAAGHRVADLAASDAAEAAADAGQERASQCDLLRDIFGNPFRAAPAIDPAWLAWNDGTVTKLAEAAYENRSLPEGTLEQDRLAVLADALEEAGCSDEEMLGHLRGPGPHVRGCHVVDTLMGKA
jgi:hypothetical protein